MGSFKVGDLVVVVGKRLSGIADPRQASLPTLFGRTGTVVSVGNEFADSLGRYRNDGITLDISNPGCYLPPERLELKRPPSKDEFTAGEWELCPWSPYRVWELS
jgi:hypothetical protein